MPLSDTSGYGNMMDAGGRQNVDLPPIVHQGHRDYHQEAKDRAAKRDEQSKILPYQFVEIPGAYGFFGRVQLAGEPTPIPAPWALYIKNHDGNLYVGVDKTDALLYYSIGDWSTANLIALDNGTGRGVLSDPSDKADTGWMLVNKPDNVWLEIAFTGAGQPSSAQICSGAKLGTSGVALDLGAALLSSGSCLENQSGEGVSGPYTEQSIARRPLAQISSDGGVTMLSTMNLGLDERCVGAQTFSVPVPM